MTESERVGVQIKEMRVQCGLTQEKVANDLFMSQSYLRLIEHGKANPSINMVNKIISYLEGALACTQQSGKAGHRKSKASGSAETTTIN